MRLVADHDKYLKGAKKEPIVLNKRKVQDVPLTVHIIPHTHDDVGWRKTPEEYFNGARPLEDERSSVALILDTMVDELFRDSRRTFTYVEMKFFTMWYKEQD
jgi:hypothetical protein